MTSAEPRRAAEEPGSGAARPRTFLIERQNTDAEVPSNSNAKATDNPEAVVIAIVEDPEKLLRERGLAFHGDVVDLLTDLIIEAMGRDGEPSD